MFQIVVKSTAVMIVENFFNNSFLYDDIQVVFFPHDNK